jgi:hypothetical protein
VVVRRRARQRGQIVPLFAVLMVVLTGFVALDLDSGVAFDQSRTDQDTSDAASLAATYWIYSNVNDQTQPNLGGALLAAANVAKLDCTGAAAPCSLNLNLYGSNSTYNGPGSALCTQVSVANVAISTEVSAAETSLAACSATLASIYYVGASVGSTANTYLGALVTKTKSFAVNNQAVAQVVGGTGGTSKGMLYLTCVLCVLGGQNSPYSSGATEGLTINNYSDGLDLNSDGANMDINQGLDCEGSSDAATINTYTINSKGQNTTPIGSVDVAGAYTDNCGSLTWDPGSSTSPDNPTVNTKPIGDPLQNMMMPSLSSCPGTGTNYGNTYGPSTPITTNGATLQPGCYNQIVIDGKSTPDSDPSGVQDCVSDGDGIHVIFKPGTYIIYGGLTIEGEDPTVESDNSTQITNPSNGQDCNAGGVTLDFVCQTSNYNGTGVAGPASCETSGGAASTGAGLTMNTQQGGNPSADCNGNGLDTKDNNLPCDFQWNLFPPNSGDWENLVILFDRYNNASIVTASQTPDPDSDHNGGIYAPSATYVMANYGTVASGPVEGAGYSCITPLGAPVIVDYMQVYANYTQASPACTEYVWADGSFSFQLDNDVELNGGGPGGLAG